MKKENNQAWKIAIYFVLFELFFWIKGIEFVRAIQYLIEYKKPLIADAESVGVFHSYIEVWIAFLFLFLSVWCLKQFIKNLIKNIKEDG